MTRETAHTARSPLFSETDVRLLIMTVAGVVGCILGFVMGLLTAR